MKFNSLVFVLLFLAALLARPSGAAPAAEVASASGRERLSLDRGWRFFEGDIPFPAINTHRLSYENAKAGKAWGAAAPNYDDSTWRTVDLPHDWAVEQPFDPAANISQGYRRRGIGWYRRSFHLAAADRGRHLEVQLDGIATHATVWINGVLAHRNWCGYTSSYIDITSFAKFGDEVNTIAVRVDADAQEGWWYEGAGIYRHTWLLKRSPVHIETDGVFANPIRTAEGRWSIPVEVTLNSSDRDAAQVQVESTLLDPQGGVVVTAGTRLVVAPLASSVATFQLAVTAPQLWSLEEPTLYRVRTVVRRGGVVVDDLVTTCGFRTIRFDAAEGFFLNDQPVKLLGTCNHQDHAGVGVAVPDSLWEFRLRRLKEMGSNAYRCAHNPPAAEFLDACDRQGMLVMDESRNFGATPEKLDQLAWMVRRDRNHPSIILWSVFNEEPSQGTAMGYEMVRRASAVVKRLDTMRPVTAAQNDPGSTLLPVNASRAADVVGFNYAYRDFDAFHAAYPNRPLFSSEDTSTVMTRGEYVTDLERGVLDSYDTQAMPWGLTHREAWRQVAERPYVAGTMVWTGFDYRGEPQPLEWPATGSSFGIMDLCGFPKAAFYLHQAQWIQDRPILHLVPHWNWAGAEGQPIQVMALTNAAQVELWLNGRKVAEGPVDKYEMVTFEVPYAPGRLEAVARTDGAEVARFVVETTGAPAALRLVPDRPRLAGDGYDAMPVTVEVVDAQGRVVPYADSLVDFALEGPGRIIGLNNGDPTSHEPEKGSRHSVFHGLAQVILQSAFAGQGQLALRATSPGLESAEVVLDVATVAPVPAVPVAAPSLVLSNWKRSPVTAERPDPMLAMGNTDMNTWSNYAPGELIPLTDGRFAIFRIQFTPHQATREAGGQILLRDVVGRAEIWLDGERVATKTDEAGRSLTLPLAAGAGPHTLSVVIETTATGAPAGLGGIATIE